MERCSGHLFRRLKLLELVERMSFKRIRDGVLGMSLPIIDCIGLRRAVIGDARIDLISPTTQSREIACGVVGKIEITYKVGRLVSGVYPVAH